MPKSNPMASLQIMTRCPMCDSKYGKEGIKIIDKKDGIITLYLNCFQCKSSVMMLIMAGNLNITSISTLTDIIEDDIEKMGGNCIEYDDVLEIHKFFQSESKKTLRTSEKLPNILKKA